MEQKKNTLLNVTSILMIIGGVLGIIIAVMAIFTSFATIAVLAGQGGYGGLIAVLIIACILAVAGAVIELIAGLTGKKAATENVGGKKCITLAIVIIALSVAGIVLNIITSGMTAQPLNVGQTLLNAVLSLVLPVLYIFGAKQIGE